MFKSPTKILVVHKAGDRTTSVLGGKGPHDKPRKLKGTYTAAYRSSLYSIHVSPYAYGLKRRCLRLNTTRIIHITYLFLPFFLLLTFSFLFPPMSPVSVQSTINTNIPCKRKHVEEDTASSTGDNDNLLSSMSLPDLLLLLTNSVTPTVPIPQDATSSTDTTTISTSPITITNDVIAEESPTSISCFDQETAPPSSILPPMLGDDWFLLDNALPPVHHEAPESPSCSSASSFSAPSSSPSITPVQQPMDMFATATTTTTEQQQQQESNEFTVMIMTGRVAQKSYGTEKR